MVAGEEPDRALSEAVFLLGNSASEIGRGPKIDKIIRVMTQWAHENGVDIDGVDDR